MFKLTVDLLGLFIKYIIGFQIIPVISDIILIALAHVYFPSTLAYELSLRCLVLLQMMTEHTYNIRESKCLTT